MDNRTLKDKILYNKYSWLIPFHPLIAWGDTVRDLNKFYKRPEINLTDSPEDLRKKNDMRHMVGLARINKTYYNPLAVGVGAIKELADYSKDFFDPKEFGKVKEETKQDTKVDWGNNFAGINYTDKYPKASSEDIMQYAWGLTNGAKPIEEQPKSKLYEMITNKIETLDNKHLNSDKDNLLYGYIKSK